MADFFDLIISREMLGTPNNGTPIPILLPCHSHKNPLKYGNGMGPAYRKGASSLGVPKIPYNFCSVFLWWGLLASHRLELPTKCWLRKNGLSVFEMGG